MYIYVCLEVSRRWMMRLMKTVYSILEYISCVHGKIRRSRCVIIGMETSSLSKRAKKPREERNDAAGKSNGSAGDCCFEIHGEVQGVAWHAARVYRSRLPLESWNLIFLFVSPASGWTKRVYVSSTPHFSHFIYLNHDGYRIYLTYVKERLQRNHFFSFSFNCNSKVDT